MARGVFHGLFRDGFGSDRADTGSAIVSKRSFRVYPVNS